MAERRAGSSLAITSTCPAHPGITFPDQRFRFPRRSRRQLPGTSETGYTAESKPVRVMVPVIPGDTLILQYTIPA
jgi:hypothetical protein